MIYYNKMRLDNLLNIATIKYKDIVDKEAFKNLLFAMQASNKPYAIMRDEIYSIF